MNDPTYGSGNAAQDPGGYVDTIDPSVDVLRVDRLVHRHRMTVHVPLGAWSTFADHGTVVHSNYQVYSGDHLGVAARVFSQLMRRAGHVPASQPVIDVYPNADEGDQTAALAHLGPSGADFVGRAEAAKMFEAWKAAGAHLSATPLFDRRWTVTCFCGRPTETGPVAGTGVIGLPFATGAPEGRGPLYDDYGLNFSGVRLPFSAPPQGDKVAVPVGSFPPAVPVSVTVIGHGAIAAVPGESTVMVGRRFRAAVLSALAPAHVTQVAIGGLADDYINYITTPDEYEWQSYEGGSTLFGPNEATFLQDRLVELAGDLVAGRAAPAPDNIDTSYGVHPNGPPYPPGAAGGVVAGQPAAVTPRLGHVQFAWNGGPSGYDRPLDTAFVRAQRLGAHGRWSTVDTDLGLDMLWHVDSSGHYSVDWQPPLSTPTGVYRLLVSATRYTLASASFRVTPFTGLVVAPVGGGAAGVRLAYPPADPISDWTTPPPVGRGASVTFLVGGRPVRARRPSPDGSFLVRAPAGASVSVPPGAARDGIGNSNGSAVAAR